MARVEFRQVRKVFENGHEAVARASFAIEDGEFAVLVGPSGCGKSTTLRMLAGLETVTEGEILIGGTVVNEMPPKDRDIAMVFQNYALYPHMTVFDNMAFGLKLRRYPKREIRGRVTQAAEVLGIGGILDRKPKQLSGGQQQRVAVGRAIVRKPQVFLFDEPLSNLDAKLRMQMRAEITKLHRRLGATMIYVTHDQVEAMTMGDRIVVMRAGHVQQIDAPLALYNRPANTFVASFIGSPSMNLVPGQVAEGAGRAVVSEVFAAPVECAAQLGGSSGADVKVGFRPEHLFVCGSEEAPGSALLLRPATVSLVEPLGHETVVYGRVGEATLVARLQPQAHPDPGQTVHLAIDPSHLHFFDGAEGHSLTWQRKQAQGTRATKEGNEVSSN